MPIACCGSKMLQKLTKIQMMLFVLSFDDHDKIIENAKSLLETVQNTLTTGNVHNKSTQQFLQDINLDVETYMDALKISQRGPNIILK